jgi:hypothetical protein
MKTSSVTRQQADDLIDGLVTLAAVVLTFLAFDDITTDNAMSFRVEYRFLAVCAAWAVVLSARLARRGRRWLALATMGLLMTLFWGQQKIGPGTRASWEPEYVAATAALVGFLCVAIHLALSATAVRSTRPPPPS